MRIKQNEDELIIEDDTIKPDFGERSIEFSVVKETCFVRTTDTIMGSGVNDCCIELKLPEVKALHEWLCKNLHRIK